jgi:hypothetical protein
MIPRLAIPLTQKLASVVRLSAADAARSADVDGFDNAGIFKARRSGARLDVIVPDVIGLG